MEGRGRDWGAVAEAGGIGLEARFRLGSRTRNLSQSPIRVKERLILSSKLEK